METLLIHPVPQLHVLTPVEQDSHRVHHHQHDAAPCNTMSAGNRTEAKDKSVKGEQSPDSERGGAQGEGEGEKTTGGDEELKYYRSKPTWSES